MDSSKKAKPGKSGAAIKLPKTIKKMQKETSPSPQTNESNGTKNANRPKPKKKVAGATAAAPEEPLKPTAPLLVDLIVETLMGMLSLSDLKQARLVCCKWNDHAIREIEHRNYVAPLRNIAQYTKAMKKNAMFLHKKFLLKNTFTRRIGTHFALHADLMKTLHITIDAGRGVRSAVGLIHLFNIHIILSLTPNLEHLTLQNIDFPFHPYSTEPELNPVADLQKLKSISFRSELKRWYRISASQAEAILKLFRTASNLESVDIDAPKLLSGTHDLSEVGIFMDIIRNLPTTVKNLCIGRAVVQPELLFLRESRFKLESLKIHEKMMSVLSFVPNFLESHAESLQVLDLCISSLSRASTIPVAAQFPVLKNLKQLIIRTNINSKTCFEINYGSNMQRTMPKLKKLDIYNANCPALTTVFKKFVHVEHLRIHSFMDHLCHDVNVLLSGLPAPDFTYKSLNTMTEKASAADIEVFEKLTLVSASYSLRDMKNLRRLEIRSGTGETVDIKESTAYFAFLKLQPLELLSIKNVTFSEKLIDALKNHHHAAIVTPSTNV